MGEAYGSTLMFDPLSTSTIIIKPTGALRWSHSGKLQQRVEVLESRGGTIIDGHLEWRDVPTEQEP